MTMQVCAHLAVAVESGNSKLMDLTGHNVKQPAPCEHRKGIETALSCCAPIGAFRMPIRHRVGVRHCNRDGDTLRSQVSELVGHSTVAQRLG